MKSVISFSLWGDNPRYNGCALANVREAKIYYPDWTCRFYVDERSPMLEALQMLTPIYGVEVIPMKRDYVPPYFWRFYAADDSDVERVLFRDVDSRVNAREHAAVVQWFHSGLDAHVMRDVEGHAGVKICAGMWGLRGRTLGSMRALIEHWIARNPAKVQTREADEYFLGDVVWPKIRGSCVVHGHGTDGQPLPKHGPMRFGDYVGQVIEPSAIPPFSIVVPSRNPDNIRACLQRFTERGVAADRVIVVDDGAGPMATGLGARVVGGKKPFVFSRNVNIGIEAAGTDDVFVWNDDALLISQGGIETLLRAAYPEAWVGICSVAGHGRMTGWQEPKPWTQTETPWGSARCRRVPTPWRINFAAVYIPRSTLAMVGPLDERFDGYGFDDDDYCIRTRRAKLDIAVCDGCVVDHTGGCAHPTYVTTESFASDSNRAAEIFRAKWGNEV